MYPPTIASLADAPWGLEADDASDGTCMGRWRDPTDDDAPGDWEPRWLFSRLRSACDCEKEYENPTASGPLRRGDAGLSPARYVQGQGQQRRVAAWAQRAKSPVWLGPIYHRAGKAGTYAGSIVTVYMPF